MKKVDILLVLAVLCIGCGTNNEIIVANQADGNVSFQFRAESVEVPPGETKSITGIPNGSYAYSTIYPVPSDVKGVVPGKELSGQMNFSTGSTKTRITYCAYISTSDTTYHFNAVITSADRNDVNPVGSN